MTAYLVNYDIDGVPVAETWPIYEGAEPQGTPIEDAGIQRYVVTDADPVGTRLVFGEVIGSAEVSAGPQDSPEFREQLVELVIKPEIERRILAVASVLDQHNTVITVALAREYLAGGLTAGQRATLEAAMPAGVSVANFVTNAEALAIMIRDIKDVKGAALKAYARDLATTAEQLAALDATDEVWWA